MTAGSVDALTGLPEQLWSPLLRGVRRAVERLDRSELPAGLRPFSTWKPERLAGEHPRRAVAAALGSDPRLREAVGESLDGDAYDDAAEADPGRLVATHGADQAAAALAARARWDDLAQVAAEEAERMAARRRAKAEAAARRDDERAHRDRHRTEAGLAAARRDRDAARRRAEAAEQRLRQERTERKRLQRQVAELREELTSLQDTRQAEQRDHARRLARLQQRADRADQRARTDDDRALRVAADLESLAADLREAIGSRADSPSPGADEPPADTGRAVPRDVAAATPGRPARLPRGLAEDDPKAVRALLQVPGLHLVLDGYNITKDAQGLPHGRLDEQRHWLLRHAAGVRARHRCRATAVFDGTHPRFGDPPSPRGVAVAFTAGDETADERIEALVGADRETPVLVVTSDREVAAACRDLGANVTTASAFLAATRA